MSASSASQGSDQPAQLAFVKTGRHTQRHHTVDLQFEAAERWPQIDFAGVTSTIFEPQCGYLLARQSCELVLETFRAEGGTYRQAHARPGRAAAGLRLRD